MTEVAMPNRSTHVWTAAPLGFSLATGKAFDQNEINRCLEGIGGLVGGVSGGLLPDILDPPDSPWHRSTAHGMLPVGTAAVFWGTNLDSWQMKLRQLADYHHGELLRAADVVAAGLHALIEWALRLLAGFVAGFGVGYLSHVVLDFRTLFCLPLVS